VYLPTLPYSNGGLLFSITNKFAEPIKEKVNLCENGVIIAIGNKLIIKNECCVDAFNVGSKRLTGSEKF
jgi:hypothetical protein